MKELCEEDELRGIGERNIHIRSFERGGDKRLYDMPKGEGSIALCFTLFERGRGIPSAMILFCFIPRQEGCFSKATRIYTGTFEILRGERESMLEQI